MTHHLPKGINVRLTKATAALLPALVAVGAAVTVTVTTAQAAPPPATTIASSGVGTAITPRSVSMFTAQHGRQLATHALNRSPLGRNGKGAGDALPARAAVGRKTVPLAASVVAGPNGGPHVVAQPLIAPPATQASFSGINSATSNCGCQPPDVNAAVSPTQIMEVVNLKLRVYNKAGTAVACGAALSTFLGTSEPLSDPRVMYDIANGRWFMDLIPIPTASTQTPAMYLAASQSSNPCGNWWIYRIGFSGASFPAGALLDYPYLGQDPNAILSSTNNFSFAESYLNSTAFAIPKAKVYAGQGISFPAFATAFSTAPTTDSFGGVAPATTYFLASAPGAGYDLYAMTNSAGPGTTYTHQASIASAFNAPTRRVNQPTTTNTLDPLDGRIVWAPVYDAGFVWFAHGQDLGGFPAVRYGAIGVGSNAAFTATAFHNGTSDDFNPSLGASETGGFHAWLNWAYTDTPNGVPTNDTINGVTPGTGVPNLTSGDRIIAHGQVTTSNFRFGDFSSVAIDPAAVSGSCAAGKTALVAQQFFFNNDWDTRLARVSFC